MNQRTTRKAKSELITQTLDPIFEGTQTQGIQEGYGRHTPEKKGIGSDKSIRTPQEVPIDKFFSP